jgi:hypothetical protein
MTCSLTILSGLLLTSHTFFDDITKYFVDANKRQTVLRKIKRHIGEVVCISVWYNLISLLLNYLRFSAYEYLRKWVESNVNICYKPCYLFLILKSVFPLSWWAQTCPLCIITLLLRTKFRAALSYCVAFPQQVFINNRVFKRNILSRVP